MIVVTGGAGFIGSNIVAALQEGGCGDIVVIDWLGKEEKWRNIAKRELAAIVDPSDAEAFLADNRGFISAIIHMGAISATTEEDADLIVRTNFRLSQDLWRYCRDNAVQFIYASSAATYGDGAMGFDDRDDLASLNALAPLNKYGWSKVLFDRWVARQVAEGRKAPPQHVGLRFFNVYGPNEYHKGGQKSLVPQAVKQIRETGKVKLFKSYRDGVADGMQSRDFVYVRDVVDVIRWFLEHSEVCGLYNVGTGGARSFFDLVQAIFSAMKLRPSIEYVDMPEKLRGKYQYYTRANMAKLHDAGYANTATGLEEGVRDYVVNYLLREDMYR